MSDNPPASGFQRARRIHALEAAADSQRAHLELHATQLIHDLPDFAALRNLVNRVQNARQISQAMGGWGKLAEWWRGGMSGPSENEAGKFPWASLFSAVTGAAAIFRWYGQSRERK